MGEALPQSHCCMWIPESHRLGAFVQELRKTVVLSVYVDDFKMGGKQCNLSRAWKDLSAHLDLDPPTKLDDQVYLGIKQTKIVIPPAIVEEKAKLYREIFEPIICKDVQAQKTGNETKAPPKPKKKSKKGKAGSNASPKPKPQLSAKKSGPAIGWQYDMTGHTKQCVEKYLELAGLKESSLKPVATPCIDDHQIAK